MTLKTIYRLWVTERPGGYLQTLWSLSVADVSTPLKAPDSRVTGEMWKSVRWWCLDQVLIHGIAPTPPHHHHTPHACPILAWSMQTVFLHGKQLPPLLMWNDQTVSERDEARKRLIWSRCFILISIIHKNGNGQMHIVCSENVFKTPNVFILCFQLDFHVTFQTYLIK